MDNYNYPIGADNNLAPWNEPLTQEIEVEVVMTISKVLKINTRDYTCTEDDEDSYYDYSNCDLKEEVRSQVLLPTEAYDAIDNAIKEYKNTGSINTPRLENNIQDLKDWNVNEFEVNIL